MRFNELLVYKMENIQSHHEDESKSPAYEVRRYPDFIKLFIVQVSLRKLNIISSSWLFKKHQIYKIVLIGKSFNHHICVDLKSTQHLVYSYPLSQVSVIKQNRNLCRYLDKHKNCQVR